MAQDERLERWAGLLQMGWGLGLREEQRRAGSGGRPAALWGGGEGGFSPEEAARNPALEASRGVVLQLLLLVSFIVKKDTLHL